MALLAQATGAHPDEGMTSEQLEAFFERATHSHGRFTKDDLERLVVFFDDNGDGLVRKRHWHRYIVVAITRTLHCSSLQFRVNGLACEYVAGTLELFTSLQFRVEGFPCEYLYVA